MKTRLVLILQHTTDCCRHDSRSPVILPIRFVLHVLWFCCQCFLRHYTGPAADELDIFLGGRVTATEVRTWQEKQLGGYKKYPVISSTHFLGEGWQQQTYAGEAALVGWKQQLVNKYRYSLPDPRPYLIHSEGRMLSYHTGTAVALFGQNIL